LHLLRGELAHVDAAEFGLDVQADQIAVGAVRLG